MLNIIKANNPTAIRFNAANKWQGQTGESKGMAVFENPVLGIRACFVVLQNGYFGKGFNTLRKIFEKYAPTGDGNNNPTKYANRVLAGLNNAANYRRSTQSIKTIDSVITPNPEILYDIIAQIIEVECGNNVFNSYWNKAEVLTFAYIAYTKGTGSLKFNYGVNSFKVLFNGKLSPELQKKPVSFIGNNPATEKKKTLWIVLFFVLVAVLYFLFRKK